MNIDSIFKEFVNVVRENKKYTIGLLDNDGRITNCSDESLLGEKRDFMHRDEHNLFYPVKERNYDFGWLWLYGVDENLELMGNLFSDSLNIRLAYEISQNMLRRNVTEDDRLVKLLLDETSFDTNQIISLVHEMGFDQKKPRVAIYIFCEKGFDSRKVERLKLIPDGEGILSSLLNNYSLLIYKPVPEDADIQKLKDYVKKYLKTLRNFDITGDSCWVGTVQNKLRNYRESYSHCLWLKDYVKNKNVEVVFFADFLYEFFISRIGLKDVKNVFDYSLESSRGLDIDELIRISDSLFENNFNISQTADNLYLHKNTLVYKLKKYEESFHIDIRGDFKGRFMFVLIAMLMKEQKKRQQLGDE